MCNFPIPNDSNSNYEEEYDEYMKKIISEYQDCSICMNEMTLIKSTKGDYWVCKVCNNTILNY